MFYIQIPLFCIARYCYVQLLIAWVNAAIQDSNDHWIKYQSGIGRIVFSHVNHHHIVSSAWSLHISQMKFGDDVHGLKLLEEKFTRVGHSQHTHIGATLAMLTIFTVVLLLIRKQTTFLHISMRWWDWSHGHDGSRHVHGDEMVRMMKT